MPIPTLVLLVLSATLASCSRPSLSPPDAAPLAPNAAPEPRAERPTPVDDESLEVLRESARELLDTNCGECHTSGLPTAHPRALAVYDLLDLDWARSMSDGQLRDAEGRLREPITPTRGKEEARPMRASEAELDRFHRYVELEIRARASRRAARSL